MIISACRDFLRNCVQCIAGSMVRARAELFRCVLWFEPLPVYLHMLFEIPPLNKVRGPARIASAKWCVLRRLMLMKWLTPHGTAADLSRGVESEYGMEQILL